MVLDSQTQTISLILQDQRGTQLFLAPDSGIRLQGDRIRRDRRPACVWAVRQAIVHLATQPSADTRPHAVPYDLSWRSAAPQSNR
jgi:hypothetical protein